MSPPWRPFSCEAGIRVAALYPMIRGRLTAINGRPVEPSDYANPRAQRLAAREFNSEPGRRPCLPITASSPALGGRRARRRHRSSQVEQGLAETLGIRLGRRDHLPGLRPPELTRPGHQPARGAVGQLQRQFLRRRLPRPAGPGACHLHITSSHLPAEREDPDPGTGAPLPQRHPVRRQRHPRPGAIRRRARGAWPWSTSFSSPSSPACW
jgi:hypothetical protein